MVIVILYVWVFDLFLYSNTELFPVFFIFFTFGMFIFHLIVWYCDYLDESISAENRNLYIVILSLQKRFAVLKSLFKFRFDYCVENPHDSVISVSNLVMINTFTQILGVAMQKHTAYVFQLGLVKYFQNLLGQMRALEFANYQSMISMNFVRLVDQDNGNAYAAIIAPMNYFGGANPIFIVFMSDFCYSKSYSDSFLFRWLTNLPIANFLDIV